MKFFIVTLAFSAVPYFAVQAFPARWAWLCGLVLLMGACAITYTPRDIGGAGPDFGSFFIIVACWSGIAGLIVRKAVDGFNLSRVQKNILKIAVLPLGLCLIFGGSLW